jgi:hypothetical protein
MPNLYVAMYRPTSGNYEHWALYLIAGERHLLFQVKGQTPNFQKDASTGIPTNSRRHRRNIFLDTITVNDVAAFVRLFGAAEVDNDTSEWDCQDFVMELLEALEEEGVLDPDDEDYKANKELLKEYYGPL